MERSWWWKAALYGFVTVLAVLYLIPTVVPEDKQPAFIQKHFQKRIQLGLDLQGGLHLVYEVDVRQGRLRQGRIGSPPTSKTACTRTRA